MPSLAIPSFLVMLLIFTADITNAQTITSGVKAGVNFSSVTNAGEVIDEVTGVASVDASAKVGFAGGGFVRFRLNDRVAFQPELLITMKGVNLKAANDNGTVGARLTYLEFPLLVRYASRAQSSFVPYGLAGPSFGVKVRTSAHLDAPGLTFDKEIDNAVKSVDAGLVFGGGVDRGRYLIEARYTLGLKDVASSDVSHANTFKNRTFTILAGFNLTGR